MNKPKITIIIPTRERGDVLSKALLTVMAQDYDNLEIIVSDNFSGDHTKEIVQSANDPRIRYVNTGKRLSMTHNYEFALSHVTEGWVALIGDDDGLIPGALSRVEKIIRETNTKAIISNVCTYIWPEEANSGFGRLSIPLKFGYNIRDSEKWLVRVLDGKNRYSELPMLYNGGFIHTSLVNTIRDKGGAFYHSNQPDIFSAIALASVTDKYVYSHDPFGIAGVSKHSNGASWIKSSQKVKPAPVKSAQAGEPTPTARFFGEDIIPFHDHVVIGSDGGIPVLSCELLLYESYLQASFLHNDFAKITPDKRLGLILANYGSDRVPIDSWVEAFVEFHKLDLRKIRSRVPMLKLRFDVIKFIEHVSEFTNRYRIEPSFGLKINDVYEASLVAATVLKTRPNRLKSYVNTLRKRLNYGAQHN